MFEHALTPLDFEAVWGVQLSPWVAARVADREMRYATLSQSERDKAILELIRVVDNELPIAGRRRESDWNHGWAENASLARATGDLSTLVPGYFNKHPIVRWRGDLVRSVSPDLEYMMFATLLDWVFDTRLPQHVENIFEFGCGTGHNLLRLRERFPSASLWGLDWVASSQEAIAVAAGTSGDYEMTGLHFNYFEPDPDIEVPRNTTFVSVASLEQIGTDFVPFLEWVLAKRPSRVINIEPVGELLDESELLDYLSLCYFDKRRYLKGYLDHLRHLEERGKVNILEASRSQLGSYFVDGYSLVVWEPVDG